MPAPGGRLMAPRPRIFVSDAELGKKDDDRKLRKATVWHRPWLRKRRIFGLVFACFFVWQFIKAVPIFHRNILEPAFPTSSSTSQARNEGKADQPPSSETAQAPKGAPPGAAQRGEQAESPSHDYDGPVKFYHLAASLHGIARTMGHRERNKNVLFAASDLKSAAAIIPMACEMARWKRNFVHLAVMGRNDIDLESIQEINGAEKESCDVYWHDARPDYASYSSDRRMEISVAGALGHLHNFMHPQAIIVADAEHEDVFFVKATRSKSVEFGCPVIKIPRESPARLLWLTRLDARALSCWHTAAIDILVHASAKASGSIIRLLQSLENADYAGSVPPKLIIELPYYADSATESFLKTFHWPPSAYQGQEHSDRLVLRRRIPEKKISQEEASIRLIESFYPTDPQGHHVLLLSTQTEVSPVYFHFLKFNLLEYKHSTIALEDSQSLFGISLESPSMHLNGTTSFLAPISTHSVSDAASHVSDNGNDHDKDGDTAVAPFLWQAPNSNAALYFGDKWIELHSFLTKRYSASHHPSTRSYHRNRRKSISEMWPAWTEYMLDLMRTRGYSILYPSLILSSSQPSSPVESIVLIHNELYNPPEEFNDQFREKQSVPAKLEATSVLIADESYLSSHHPIARQSDGLNVERPLLRNFLPLLSSFPTDYAATSSSSVPREVPPPLPMPPLSALPMLDHVGDRTTQEDLQRRAKDAAIGYRNIAGGCSEPQSQQVDVTPGSAADLFCLDEDDYEYIEDEENSDDNTSSDKHVLETNQPRPESSKAHDERLYKSTAASTKQSTYTQEPDEARISREATITFRTTESSDIVTSVEVETVPRTVESAEPFHHGHGGDGVASVVDAIVNPARYAETARAGFKQKLKDKVKEVVPVLKASELQLTREERKELEEFRARQKGSVTPSEHVVNAIGSQDLKHGTRDRLDLDTPVSVENVLQPVTGTDSYPNIQQIAQEAEIAGSRNPMKTSDDFHHGHGGGGVASVVHAIVDPAAYAETARAGMENKLKQAEAARAERARAREAEAAADAAAQAVDEALAGSEIISDDVQAMNSERKLRYGDSAAAAPAAEPLPLTTSRQDTVQLQQKAVKLRGGKLGRIRDWDEGGNDEGAVPRATVGRTSDDPETPAEPTVPDDPKARNEKMQAEKDAEDEGQPQERMVGKGTVNSGLTKPGREGVDVIDEEDEDVVLARQRAHESAEASAPDGMEAPPGLEVAMSDLRSEKAKAEYKDREE